jgi:anti-anti-sigma factor
MNITQHPGDKVLRIEVSGRLDSNTSQTLEDALSAEDVKGHPALLLDLAGVQYVSSAGLRVLLKAAKAARAAKTKLALAGLTPQVREVFDVSGFSSIFQIFADANEAKKTLAG